MGQPSALGERRASSGMGQAQGQAQVVDDAIRRIPSSGLAAKAATNAGAGASHRRAPTSSALLTTVVCIAYAIAGPTLILVNKHILSELEFPYPYALTCTLAQTHAPSRVVVTQTRSPLLYPRNASFSQIFLALTLHTRHKRLPTHGRCSLPPQVTVIFSQCCTTAPLQAWALCARRISQRFWYASVRSSCTIERWSPCASTSHAYFRSAHSKL
jgi:hypothetical protein